MFGHQIVGFYRFAALTESSRIVSGYLLLKEEICGDKRS
jgi:hypothetical protein